MTFEPFASPTRENTTDFGDDAFAGCPAGSTPVISSQPTHGTVEITGSSGWRIVTQAIPALASGPVSDSWSWVPSGGGPAVTVDLSYQNLDV